jgi:hypothetical protein
VHSVVVLPGQLDRVKAVSTFSTIEYQIAAASGPTARYAPTIAYHIPNAALVDGSIYSGRLRHFVAPRKIAPSLREPIIELDTAPLASNMIGTQFFGHWLTDDCTQYRLAEDYGTPLCVNRPASQDQPAYEAYLEQHWTPTSSARSGRLRAHFVTNEPSLLVYLKRGSTGVFRPIANEDQLIDELLKRGFVVADIKSERIEQLLAKLVNARIVISLEGSHIARCCYSLPEKADLSYLSFPSKFTAVHRGWTEARLIRFGFIIGSETPDGYHEPRDLRFDVRRAFGSMNLPVSELFWPTPCPGVV